jgi:uracil-DNA glycosylase
MSVAIEESWKIRLESEFKKVYFENLINFVKAEFITAKIFPPGRLIFNAFEKCPFENVRVVIIGQDPYHNEGQADGLSFSVQDGVRFPPSLMNIFKEIHDDLGVPIPESGNLERWARQGVLMLNAVLTVRANAPTSHQKMGWEYFTDKVIELISNEKENVVFLLWGKYAQEKGKIIDRNRHLVLEAAHPSPLAGGAFFGCKHFSKTNIFLEEKGLKKIDW